MQAAPPVQDAQRLSGWEGAAPTYRPAAPPLRERGTRIFSTTLQIPRSTLVGGQSPSTQNSAQTERGGEGRPPLTPFEQIIHRAFSHLSTEAFVSDFVRRAFEANRQRGNPPASKFAIEHLLESTLLADDDSCIICQDGMEKGAVTLTMPCGHVYHKCCLVTWLEEHNTCPVCRCEIESHCPRYNQANFSKLKGELCEETVTSQQRDAKPGAASASASSASSTPLPSMPWGPDGPRAQVNVTPGGPGGLRLNVQLSPGTLTMMRAHHIARNASQQRTPDDAPFTQDSQAFQRTAAGAAGEGDADGMAGKRREPEGGAAERTPSTTAGAPSGGPRLRVTARFKRVRREQGQGAAAGGAELAPEMAAGLSEQDAVENQAGPVSSRTRRASQSAGSPGSVNSDGAS